MHPVIDALLTRRSVTAKDMIEPGPSREQLDIILQAGHRVPDHGKIGPWRFIIFEGEARAKFGQHLAKIFARKNEDVKDKLLDFEADRFNRAPTVVAVISSPVDHPKVPVWEQELAAGAVCMNMLHATHAQGFVGQWLTEWYAFDDDVNSLLALTPQERVAGFMYIGRCATPPSERVRPELADRISYWGE